jgi:hypothetical protein
MAATATKNIFLHKTADGVAPEVVVGKVAGSQGIMIPNTPMYLSTDGTWKISDTSDGTGDTYQGLFVGLQNASSTFPLAAELTANTEIRVMLIDPADYYCVYLENNGTDIAEAQTYVGEQYGLTVSGTAGEVGYTSCDVNNANGAVAVKNIMSNIDPIKYDTTSTPGLAIVQFLAAVSTQAGERA